jgi:hypothetical protein
MLETLIRVTSLIFTLYHNAKPNKGEPTKFRITNITRTPRLHNARNSSSQWYSSCWLWGIKILTTNMRGWVSAPHNTNWAFSTNIPTSMWGGGRGHFQLLSTYPSIRPYTMGFFPVEIYTNSSGVTYQTPGL